MKFHLLIDCHFKGALNLDTVFRHFNTEYRHLNIPAAARLPAEFYFRYIIKDSHIQLYWQPIIKSSE